MAEPTLPHRTNYYLPDGRCIVQIREGQTLVRLPLFAGSLWRVCDAAEVTDD